MTVRRRVARRLERALLGAVMNVIALIIERRVLKAIRGAGGNRSSLPAGGESPGREWPGREA